MAKITVEIHRDEKGRPSILNVKKGRSKFTAEIMATDSVGHASKLVLTGSRGSLPNFGDLLLFFHGKHIARVRGLNWHDRDPKPIWLQWGGVGQNPHGSTKQWTYTVPKNRMAFLEFAEIWIQRYTVAAPVGVAQAYIRYQPSGGSIHPLMYRNLVTNNVGDERYGSIGHALLLYPGDIIDCVTQDSSTGGKVAYNTSAKLTEFDV